MKDKMLEYLTGHSFCVISTVDAQSRPESAFVGLSFSTDLEVVIGTSKSSRKLKNILQNGRVAIVVGDLKGTVQYEGIAEELSYEDCEALVREQTFTKLPKLDKYRDDPTNIWIKITPTWIRFTQHGAEDKIEEFTEFAS
jgi:general stress protein 26